MIVLFRVPLPLPHTSLSENKTTKNKFNRHLLSITLWGLTLNVKAKGKEFSSGTHLTITFENELVAFWHQTGFGKGCWTTSWCVSLSRSPLLMHPQFCKVQPALNVLNMIPLYMCVYIHIYIYTHLCTCIFVHIYSNKSDVLSFHINLVKWYHTIVCFFHFLR